MQAIRRFFRAVAKDDRGGQVIEYALILGLIIVAAIAVIAVTGTKVLARWNAVNSTL